MPKVTTKYRTLKLPLLEVPVFVGWRVKRLTDAEKRARKKAKEDKRDRDTKLLHTVAQASRTQEPTKRAAAKRAPAREVWGNSEPAPAARRPRRTCGQLTEDGTPCERPWSASGCGVDHAAPTKAMAARTKTASRGVPGKTAATRGSIAKKTPVKKTPTKRQPPRSRS